MVAVRAKGFAQQRRGQVQRRDFAEFPQKTLVNLHGAKINSTTTGDNGDDGDDGDNGDDGDDGDDGEDS